MSPEIIKWLAAIPDTYKVAGMKEKTYRGSDQVSIFIAKKD